MKISDEGIEADDLEYCTFVLRDVREILEVPEGKLITDHAKRLMLELKAHRATFWEEE